MTRAAWTLIVAVACGAHAAVAQSPRAWHEWSASEAQRVVKSTVTSGRIAGGRRLLNTERARSYKLRATWLTPDVVHAAGRLLQIQSRMTSDAVERLVANLHGSDETMVLIEMDPDEGSGVIPLDWEAFLQPRDEPERGVAGRQGAEPADSKVLAGVFPRNYDYDRFWVVFPLTGPGGRLFRDGDREAELIVRIYGREGHVTWRLEPSSRGVWPIVPE